MSTLGQRTPAFIRALDKTLVGEGCWEYGLRGHPLNGENAYRWRNKRMCRACMKMRDQARRRQARSAA